MGYPWFLYMCTPWNLIFLVHVLQCLCMLKPWVRDKRLTGTSGVMLIPVTYPTQCVAECTKCGFSGQANTTWGPSTEFGGSIAQTVPNSIWPSELHRNIRTHEMHKPEFKPHMQLGCCIGLQRLLTHKPITAHHLVLPDASALPLGLTYRDWLCDGGWMLRPGQWDIHIFLLRDQCLTHAYWHGNSHAYKFHFGMIRMNSPRAAKALITNARL